MTETLKDLRERVLRLDAERTQGDWFNCKYRRSIKSLNSMRGEDGRKDFNIAKLPMRSSNYPVPHEEWEANADFLAAAPDMIKLIRAQQERLERAREALGFYANKENHMPQCAFRTPISGNYGSNIQVNDNNGDRARATLAAISDEQEVKS